MVGLQFLNQFVRFLKEEGAGVFGGKGLRSSACSPRPINFTGRSSSFWMATTMPPFEVPSFRDNKAGQRYGFVGLILAQCIGTDDASTTSRVSCDPLALGGNHPWEFSNSRMRLCLV